MGETIMNIPLAKLRPLISVRAWNLLTRNGFGKVSDVRDAQQLGALKDIKGLGATGLLEIRLALDSLPSDPADDLVPGWKPPDPMAPEPAAPSGLTERELRVLLGLAEAGMSERAWAWHGSHPGYPAEDQAEALNVVRRLHWLVHGMPRPDGVPDPLDDPREGRDPVVFGGELTTPPAPAPIPSADGNLRPPDNWPPLTPPPDQPGPVTPSYLPPPPPPRTAPEPMDDEFEGYVIDAKTGRWGDDEDSRRW